MAKKLKFAHRFSNGVIRQNSADLRAMRKCGRFDAIRAFSGGKAPPDEVERWVVEVMTTIADRTKHTIACLAPSGAMWNFRLGRHPELVGLRISKVGATIAAMAMKARIAGDHGFSNGSKALVAIDFSKEPTHVAITLFGAKPDAAEAWLAPMLACGEHYGVAGVEEELARAGILWWRPPKSTGAQGVNGHLRDFLRSSSRIRTEVPRNDAGRRRGLFARVHPQGCAPQSAAALGGRYPQGFV